MEKLYKYIEDHSDEYLKWLEKSCNQPSISAQNIGMLEMKELVKHFLLKIDADIEEIETGGYPIIYGEINNGRDKTLMFYNHYDVQPPEPLEEWLSDPFRTTIENGKITARGTADNKGNLIARICAIHAYQHIYGELPVNIKFVFEGEEEVGSPHLEWFAENYPEKMNVDGIIWEGGSRGAIDKRLHVGLGVKGISYVELICKGADFDLHSSEAAIIENPAWRLVWALNTLKNEKEEILIDGFYDDVMPLTDKEKAFIQTMAYNEDEIKEQYGITGFLNNLKGDSLKKRLTAAPTCTICGIESGYTGEGTKTVLPAVAKVKLDFRLVPDQDPKKIVSLLRKHLDKNGYSDIEIKEYHGMVPFNTDPNSPFVKTVLDGVKDLYQEPPIILRNLAGSSPMNKMLKNSTIPAVQIGVANTQSNIHGPNENIYVEDYIQGIKLTANIIHRLK